MGNTQNWLPVHPDSLTTLQPLGTDSPFSPRKLQGFQLIIPQHISPLLFQTPVPITGPSLSSVAPSHFCPCSVPPGFSSRACFSTAGRSQVNWSGNFLAPERLFWLNPSRTEMMSSGYLRRQSCLRKAGLCAQAESLKPCRCTGEPEPFVM